MFKDLPYSYWALASKLKGKPQSEQDKLIDAFVEENQSKDELLPLTRFVMGEISEDELMALTHDSPNERLKFKDKVAKQRARDALKKKD